MGRDIKWNPRFAEEALARLQELSLLAANQGSQLTIWPETSIPYAGFRDSLALTQRIGNLARVSRSNLLVGSIELAGDAEHHTYNTASLIGFQGGFVDHYDKQRLVPGGEFLPFESLLRPFSIFDRVMRYLPGGGSGVILCHFPPPGPPTSIPGGANAPPPGPPTSFPGGANAPPPGPPTSADLHLGVLICFESMVPSVAADRVRAGAEALSVSTNDGWFGDSSAITHHFEMAIFRAVETARPVIQSGNTGISGVINAYGEVLGETKANQKSFVVGPLVPGHERTFYVSWGDWVAWLAGLGWFCTSLFCLSKWQQEGPRAGGPKSPPQDQ
jgi:apolipoprotein N-acyltransferase